MRHLVWLRADLRSIDNTALHAACVQKDAEVACVYAITPDQWKAHDTAACRIDFELRTLAMLQTELNALNIPLLLVSAADYSLLPATLARLCKEHHISALYFNRQYEVNELARDQAVSAEMARRGIVVHACDDQCVVKPGTLLTGDGRYYSVFTPFKRVWLTRIFPAGLTVLPRPRKRPGRFAESAAIPAAVKGFVSHVPASRLLELWPAGEKAALKRLQQFTETRLRAYDQQRDFPALHGTSTLSPWLAAGVISVRQCMNAAMTAKQESAQGSQGIDTWISELCWRDFYKHIMFGYPHVCRYQPFRRETAALHWRHDPEPFQRWCEGHTGFPIIDAAMRQLKETGWMHNRLRMVVAMFLTKDLFIDWRWGEGFFMQNLIDGDFSANNGGWQWSASTGNDAAPYFRVFNPVLQSRKYDPDGGFIRRYVPELAGLDNKSIHAPYEGKQNLLFPDYPQPMVDHATAKDFAVAQFRNLKLLEAAPPD
jgi:deoxyribodipyrimidine photo-lyase